MSAAGTTPVVAVAVSGGRDSTALLHATVRSARELGLSVVALHVHHGLVPEADAWVAHLVSQCGRWRSAGWPVRLRVARLQGQPAPGDSVEAWARRERYAALQGMAREEGADLILLAHHQRDQAETVLLQLLRGAGPRGLASMPMRAERDGLLWARPWLEQPARAVSHYVQRHRLTHIEDSSNQDPRFARNRLRQQVWPLLQRCFPDVDGALPASARHAARAAQLQSEVAQADLVQLLDDAGRLQLLPWRTLSPARQWLALQAWLQAQAVAALSDATVDRLQRELQTAGQGSWPLGVTLSLRLYRSRLSLVPSTPVSVTPPDTRVNVAPPLQGEQHLPAWQGTIQWQRVADGGLDEASLTGAQWCARSGATWQFQSGPGRVPRSLKKQFQAAGIPAWERSAPILCRGETVLWVSGLGVDVRVTNTRTAPRWLPVWLPD